MFSEFQNILSISMDRIYIIGLGQPIMDLVKEVSEDFLEEHQLENNSAIRVEVGHEKMFAKIREDQGTIFVPGGSTTNTMKIVSKLLQKNDRKVGCIGKHLKYDILFKFIFQVQ